MTNDPQIFDPGMQPERTALSWRRTALSMVVGSIAALRVFPAVFGARALIPTGIAVMLAVLVFVFAQLRYRRNHRALLEHRAGAEARLADGRMIALVAIVTLAFALIAAGFLVAKLL